ncbi:MAG: hypothetical protein D6820_09560 [Lentisphaerae bacterium]|nr:MAG: hypothetical protein D6820_09560 [Lentisphaerota bacterium]
MADEEKNLPAPAENNGEEPKADETLEIKAPQVGEQSETTRLERKKKLSLRKEDTGETPAPGETLAVPSPGDTQSTVLQDPTRRRETNTASLKRLRPSDLTPGGSLTDDPDNTETVNIRVIKEQKKQFRNMMTASQTLAVDSDAEKTQAAPAPGASTPGETLKVKAPVETRTESISRQATPGATGASAPSEVTASPKATLRIKAPPGVAGGAQAAGGATKPGSTLRIKAPAPAAAGAADPSARTVKQTAPGGPAKTLKLKQPAPGATQQRQPAPQQQPAAAQQPSAAEAMEEMAAEEAATPGIGYTILSFVAIAAACFTLVQIIQSNMGLFGKLIGE